MPPRPATENTLIETIADRLHTYVTGGSRRSELLRAAADDVVRLRGTIRLDSGRVDWGGRSARYRTAIARAFELAEIPERQRERTRTALAYHVANAVRAAAPPDELAAAGITAPTKSERAAASRAAVDALVDSLTGDRAEAEALRALIVAEAAVRRVTRDDVAALADADSLAARQSLTAIRDHAEALLSQ